VGRPLAGLIKSNSSEIVPDLKMVLQYGGKPLTLPGMILYLP
jgi:hypothetical protein